MTQVGAGTLFPCPSCAGPMHRQSFARRPEGRVDLDFCFACQSIWFDAYESAQLTPGATIELFRLIHAHPAANPQPISGSASCPRCAVRLVLTHDVQRTNKFLYYRCPFGHGRLITFFHFLREKQFVRSLSGAEISRLKATVSQVRCSSCGAPVNVEKDAACAHCKSPLSILDTDAVQRALAELDAADRRAIHAPNLAAASMDALLAGRRTEQRLRGADVGMGSGLEVAGGIDLLRETISLFARLLDD